MRPKQWQRVDALFSRKHIREAGEIPKVDGVVRVEIEAVARGGGQVAGGADEALHQHRGVDQIDVSVPISVRHQRW